MSISTYQPLVGGTNSTTGGTATDLLEKTPQNGGKEVVYVLDDGTEYLLNTKYTFTTKEPVKQISAPNGYTQARSEAVIHVPKILANGNRTVSTIRVKLSVDHEVTSAEISEMLVKAAQVLTDSNLTNFWALQALS